MNIKKNDTVVVIAGKDKGKTGKVLSAEPKKNRVTVEGVNIQKKHKKPRSANSVGGIVDQTGAIDASNVMIMCDSCKKATRVAHKIENEKKIRVCKKCGANLDKAVVIETAEDKKKAKKAKAEKAATEAKAEETAKTEEAVKTEAPAAEETATAEPKKTTRKPAAKKAKAEGETAEKKTTKKSSKAAE